LRSARKKRIIYLVNDEAYKKSFTTTKINVNISALCSLRKTSRTVVTNIVGVLPKKEKYRIRELLTG
jgi:hypothetical protein